MKRVRKDTFECDVCHVSVDVELPEDRQAKDDIIFPTGWMQVKLYSPQQDNKERINKMCCVECLGRVTAALAPVAQLSGKTQVKIHSQDLQKLGFNLVSAVREWAWSFRGCEIFLRVSGQGHMGCVSPMTPFNAAWRRSSKDGFQLREITCLADLEQLKEQVSTLPPT